MPPATLFFLLRLGVPSSSFQSSLFLIVAVLIYQPIIFPDQKYSTDAVIQFISSDHFIVPMQKQDHLSFFD